MTTQDDSASPLDIPVRARFEKWISSPPFELPIHKNGANSAWPGDYGHYETQLAWCAWEDATRTAYMKIAADYRRVGKDRFTGADVAIWCEYETDASNAEITGG